MESKTQIWPLPYYFLRTRLRCINYAVISPQEPICSSLYLKNVYTLVVGVPVNRLFRAAADLRGECKRRVGGRGVLRRSPELPGPELHSRRVRHLLQSVPEGISDGGGHHWLLHVRS